MSFELFKVKKYSKARNVFEFLKLAAEPKVLENVKRSWKKSWKVMEFEELKRVRTLSTSIILRTLRQRNVQKSVKHVQNGCFAN